MKMPTLSSDRAARVKDVDEVFLSSYPEFQYRFVDFFVEHLSDVAHVFDGDLVKVMVLAVLGQSHIHSLMRELQGGADFADALLVPSGTNASRLADILAVPRETVRRKLAELAAQGWIEQRPDGLWTMTVRDGGANARRDLSDLDRRQVERVARLFADLERIVVVASERKGAPAGIEPVAHRNGSSQPAGLAAPRTCCLPVSWTAIAGRPAP